MILYQLPNGLVQIGVHIITVKDTTKQYFYFWEEKNVTFLQQHVDRISVSPITLQFAKLAEKSGQLQEGSLETLLSTMENRPL